MKKLLLAASLLILTPQTRAVEIVVGRTHLAIPAPAGFAPVTSQMKAYSDVADRFVPPTNVQFAEFISNADASLAASGGVPESQRNFTVQTSKQMIQSLVSTADFDELKSTIKNQNAEMLKQAEAQVPGWLDKVSKGISDDYNVDANLSLTQVLPLPPHVETARSLAFSMIVKFQTNDADGKAVPFVGVVTTTFVHVQGKILFLYANAEKTGLQWSRTESQKWAEMVVAANPSAGDVAVRETSERSSGFDWGEVGKKALIGAVFGGIIGLFRLIFNKKKG